MDHKRFLFCALLVLGGALQLYIPTVRLPFILPYVLLMLVLLFPRQCADFTLKLLIDDQELDEETRDDVV